jgi:hypothetical protein
MGGLLPHYNYNFTRLVNRHSRDGSSAARIRMDDELEKTTYHEAGHCVMAVLCGAEVGRATIAPEEDGFHGIVEIYWPSGSSMADQLSVAMAGPVAEMIFSGEPYHPGFVPEWAHDWKQAWKICRPRTRNDQECLQLLEQSVAKLYKTFSTDHWWAAIAAVSDLLAAHDEIEHDDIAYEVHHWIKG